MTKKYTPAVFQPTVRPAWKGAMAYIGKEEKADILEAIICYPEETNINSRFWKDTVKPDLDEQYINFTKICELRGRGARTYWGELKLSSSSTYDKHKDNLLKDKDKSKSKDKEQVKSKDNNNINNKYNNNINNNYYGVQDNAEVDEYEDVPF